jgi:phosphomannomutase/phosphoglucomutase
MLFGVLTAVLITIKRVKKAGWRRALIFVQPPNEIPCLVQDPWDKRLDHNVFREYDIRGLVDREILDQDVVLLGKTFGTYMAGQQKKYVVVVRDCRLSSGRYRDLLVEGLVASGMDVVDVGVCPPPVFYFALRRLDRQGGIMITASHNPPE